MLSLAVPYISQRQNIGYSVILDSSDPSSTVQQIYSSDINRLTSMDPVSSYPSDSPSPPQLSPDQLLAHNSPEESQNRFLHSVLPNYTPEVTLPQDRECNKYGTTSTHTNPLPLIEHRRMSEPAALSGAAFYATQSVGDSSSSGRYIHNDNPFAFDPHALPQRPSSLYPGHLQRGASTGSLRDLRHHHSEYHPHSSQQQPEWKPDDTQLSAFQQNLTDNRSDGFDEPISPLQPNFSGALTGSPTSGMPYSPGSEHPYGPSPPGTGTSTSSSLAPLSAGPGVPCSPSRSINQHLHRSLSTPNVGGDSSSVDRKTYSFVALPGNAVKKRPRRRYDEIERLYQCSWPDCSKSYGTLNHLNAHVTMQKHGPKRTPDEFKDMRKQWRKAKKEQAAAAVAMRRDSYADLYEEHVAYDARYLSHHSQHPSSRGHGMNDGLGLPSSVTVGGMTERYSIPVEDIRYPPSHERDDGSAVGGFYDPMSARQRYMNGVPASWHGGSALSRSNLVHHQQRQHHEVFGSGSGSGHSQPSAHHTQLPQLAIGSRIHNSSPHSAPPHSHEQNTAMHGHRGLPQNSSLLTTPLSGYHSSSLVPTMPSGGGAGNVIYSSEGYELYDSDSTGRPGTGHTNFSVSQASVDEYDPHSQ